MSRADAFEAAGLGRHGQCFFLSPSYDALTFAPSPAASFLLFPAAVMEATGLAALAETYALKREELTQLRILSERFFDGLRAAFATFTARPPTMLDAGLRVESYAAFTARLGAGALAVAVEVNLQTVAVLALTEQLARALVDDLFSREVPARRARP